MSTPDQQEGIDLVWGAAAIGRLLGLTEGQAKYALTKKEIPGRKVNGHWVASKAALKRFFEEEAA